MNLALKKALVGRLKQYELANRLGVTETHLSRIVNGRQRADAGLRQRIAEELGVSVSELFADEAERVGHHE